jgi:hypothetical protein
MAEDKRRGEDPRDAVAGSAEERAERARQAAAAQAQPQNPSAAKRALQKSADAEKPNLTQKTIEGHLVGVLQAAGKEPAEAKRIAAERAAEMCSDETDDDKS